MAALPSANQMVARVSSRESGRQPDCVLGVKEWFADFGADLLQQGIEDGPLISDRMSQYFVTNYTTMHVKGLRGACNYLTLNAAMAHAGVPPTRRMGLGATLADYLALEYITPVAGTTMLAAVQTGRGGAKKPRFELMGGSSIGSRLLESGRLNDEHVVQADFDHLQLPTRLRPMHKEKILIASLECTLRDQDDIYSDAVFEEQIDKNLTSIFGLMPQSKRQKTCDTPMEQVTAEEAEELKFTWGDSYHTLVRNVRSKRGAVRSPPPCTHACPYYAMLYASHGISLALAHLPLTQDASLSCAV